MTHASSRAKTSRDAVSDAMQARVPRISSSGLSQSTAELAALPASQWRRSSGPPLSRVPEAAEQAPNMSLQLTQRGPSEAARCASTGDHQAPLFGSKHLLKGVVEVALHCAHRATTVLSWGLCEQEGRLTAPDPPFTFLLPVAANSVQRGGRSRSRRGGSGLCVGDSAWR
jgi:hypothetical protein